MSYKKLIIAADDFGLTRGVNEGMVRAYQEGVVTSLNLLPSGEAFEDALSLAKDIGLKEAGAHLALTETSPVAEAAKVRSLINDEGGFSKGHLDFLAKYFSGNIAEDEIYIEWKSQLEKAISTGIKITNLSSHEHLHMVPKLLSILIKLAKEHDVPAIRYPHSDSSSRGFGVGLLVKKTALACLEGNMGTSLRASGIIYPEHFLGFFDSGHITEDVLLDMFGRLKDGTTELVCHPGFLDKRVLDKYTFHKNSEAELFALTSRRVKKEADENKVELIGYSEFLSGVKTG